MGHFMWKGRRVIDTDSNMLAGDEARRGGARLRLAHGQRHVGLEYCIARRVIDDRIEADRGLHDADGDGLVLGRRHRKPELAETGMQRRQRQGEKQAGAGAAYLIPEPLAAAYGDRILLLPHAAADTDHPTRVAGARQAVDQIIDAIVDKRVRNLKGSLPQGYVEAV